MGYPRALLLLLPLLAAACSSPVTPTGETAPEEQEPAFFSGTVPSSDGVIIHYQIHGAGVPALVFVHGWTCNQSH